MGPRLQLTQPLSSLWALAQLLHKLLSIINPNTQDTGTYLKTPRKPHTNQLENTEQTPTKDSGIPSQLENTEHPRKTVGYLVTMSTKDSGTTRQIELLTEENFSSWFVNIRAELRTKKLWEYTQSLYTEDTPEEGDSTAVVKKKEKAIKDWEQKSQEAADLMTPTISPGIQQKLTEAEFNDGYLMLTRLRIILQPTGSSEFMRLSKEYYTLQFKAFKTVPEYLTHIKVLEEKIDSTKVTLDTNNRTILCLSMSLPREYQYLIQIWAVTPSITAEKARQMVLEASRQHNQALHNSQDSARVFKAGFQGKGKEKEPCDHCRSTGHLSEKCWTEYPQLAPDWYKEMMKDQAKHKGDSGKQARRFQARLATTTRGDDFEDNNTRISA
ncbi:hypothetical protein HO133_006098 [Letharia lupina]|uniref:Uncharacterized protein n=1 Tax=Letharia lupina TaxID=560253 RepID=A0A8H6C7M9_9LECA|nr:uncharacterized protein HO133_006098 [Letharia lupina]KAF6218139.1 hypothetical protein HO133_006098 [Letharia lupina]